MSTTLQVKCSDALVINLSTISLNLNSEVVCTKSCVFMSFQMESTIKQAEEERNKSLEAARQLYTEFQPLKGQVDVIRNSLGLECLPDLTEEDNKFTPE